MAAFVEVKIRMIFKGQRPALHVVWDVRMAAHCVAIWSEMELPVFSTKIPVSRTANATLGQSTMHRVFLGLLFFH